MNSTGPARWILLTGSSKKDLYAIGKRNGTNRRMPTAKTACSSWKPERNGKPTRTTKREAIIGADPALTLNTPPLPSTPAASIAGCTEGLKCAPGSRWAMVSGLPSGRWALKANGRPTVKSILWNITGECCWPTSPAGPINAGRLNGSRRPGPLNRWGRTGPKSSTFGAWIGMSRKFRYTWTICCSTAYRSAN